MKLLLTNIKKLVQTEQIAQLKICGAEMAKLNNLDDAYLYINSGIIEDFGTMTEIKDFEYDQQIDVSGRMIFPSFCDSHTHIVYAGSREIEFIDKIKGLSYEEIAKRGGGILNSAKLIQDISEDELFNLSKKRIEEIISLGTGAVEIKSGYGLSTDSEIKMLRVIKRLQKEMPITIVSTFLGAHSVPLEYRGNQEEYVNLIINEMIPIIASEELADYIDVFCDKGFFTVEDTDRILLAGMKYGLRAKIHANELANSGGVQVGVKYNAISVDHLEYIEDAEIQCLLNSDTMPTVLPSSAFFLNLKYSPVRQMIKAGLPIALASDYNPGSSPSGNMKLVMSMGCINYKMTPEEVINATTINSAYAMGLSETHGSIARGKVANFFITKDIPSVEFFPYAFGSNLIDRVFINGIEITQ